MQIEQSVLPVVGGLLVSAFAISYVAQTGMQLIENGDLTLKEMLKFNLRKHGFLICCALTDLIISNTQ